jgi:hypothetical protein
MLGSDSMSVTTTDPSKIFANDVNGDGIAIGDKVEYNSRFYIVQGMEHDVSTDGYYDETVYLELSDGKSKKAIFVEDSEVELLND